MSEAGDFETLPGQGSNPNSALQTDRFRKVWGKAIPYAKYRFCEAVDDAYSNSSASKEVWATGVIDHYITLAKTLVKRPSYTYRETFVATCKSNPRIEAIKVGLPARKTTNMRDPAVLPHSTGSLKVTGKPDYLIVTFPLNREKDLDTHRSRKYHASEFPDN